MSNDMNPLVFKLPVYKIRAGYFSDKDFVRISEILKKDNYHPRVIQQFISLEDGVVCGIEEARSILKLCSGFYKEISRAETIFNELSNLDFKIKTAENFELLKELYVKKLELISELNLLWEDKSNEINIFSLNDGDRIKKNDVILVIEGDPSYFAYLETILLGVITRGTSTASAVDRVISVSNNKPVLFFSSRYDHFLNQNIDGYAAMKAGAFGVSTDANAYYLGIKGLDTISTSLIGAYQGSIINAALAFDKYSDNVTKRIVATSWNNDSINDAVEIIKIFYRTFYKNSVKEKDDLSVVIGAGKNKIWGVRFDTLKSMRDKSVSPLNEESLGVSSELVWKARNIFDGYGLKDLKIIVSGGFDEKKIELFEKLNVPVDIYGIGSALLKNKIEIIADIVLCNNKYCARAGRCKKDFSKLKKNSNL